MSQKFVPGPMGSSCLTCKRSHRKCDMRQPTCLKCEKGGYECLGYNHNRHRAVRPEPVKVLKPRQLLPKGEAVQNLAVVRPVKVRLSPASGSEGSYSRSSPSSGSDIRSDSENTSIIKPSSVGSPPSLIVYYSAPGKAVHRWDRGAKPHTGPDYLQFLRPQPDEARPIALAPSLRQLFLIFNHLPTSPSDPIMAYLTSPEFEGYATSTSDGRIMDSAYFRPMKSQSEQLNNMLVSRLRNSHFSRWVILLAFKMHEDVLSGDQSRKELHIHWLENLEGAVRKRLNLNPTPAEALLLDGDLFEVSLLKTSLSEINLYVVLRSAAPRFLNTVYSLPYLWPSGSDPDLIPLANIIGSKHHALSTYTLMDTACAMAYGLPQQLNYDTSAGPLLMDYLPHEWMHSAPAEFQVLLAEINACRDQSAWARDWRETEYVLLNWQCQVTRQHDADWESWMKVAWLAVQETWRLALLAYLYLAVCGCPSDDPRIQDCVTQILQVIGTMKKPESSDVTIQFFIQYMMVGICTPSEQNRKLARRELSDLSKTLGLNLVPVMDHLWHGAGLDGHPVTWRDYVHSREALLPVPM